MERAVTLRFEFNITAIVQNDSKYSGNKAGHHSSLEQSQSVWRWTAPYDRSGNENECEDEIGNPLRRRVAVIEKRQLEQ
jgi:hypothetical protein